MAKSIASSGTAENLYFFCGLLPIRVVVESFSIKNILKLITGFLSLKN